MPDDNKKNRDDKQPQKQQPGKDNDKQPQQPMKQPQKQPQKGDIGKDEDIETEVGNDNDLEEGDQNEVVTQRNPRVADDSSEVE